MAFKPLDLQLSVPRTQEFSSLQQQAAQKPVTDQTMLEGKAAKLTEELRMQNSAVEQTGQAHVRAERDDRQNSSRGQHRGGRETRAQDEDKPAEPAHPFKGQHLDIKL